MYFLILLRHFSLVIILFQILMLAANFVLLPYYTFNYLVNSNADGSKSPLADNSLLVLLILIHYRRGMPLNDSLNNQIISDATPVPPSREGLHFYLNPYCKAMENARDVECETIFALTSFALFSQVKVCLFVILIVR